MSKSRYRYFVDPASWFKDSEESTQEQPQARAPKRKRNQALSVEQLPDGCVLIRVDFGQARARVPCPFREESLQG